MIGAAPFGIADHQGEKGLAPRASHRPRRSGLVFGALTFVG